jgi:nucleoside-diphosphate-sugar epimerase
MKIAILGASSQIAKDLICSFATAGHKELLLYARNFDILKSWVDQHRLADICSIHGYETYGELPHEVVINFIGVGDPKRAAEMGANIFDITTRFDDMVMKDLSRNPYRRYLFLSSGAVYGNVFDKPVTATSQSMIPINDIQSKDYYAIAKLNAELKHRLRPDLSIIDLRVFNMFSRTLDLESRFFITDIIRAVRDKHTLHISPDYMVRDFMHPEDFHQLVNCLLEAAPSNCTLDCYSREPIDKLSLLKNMCEKFGLKYEIVDNTTVAVNATGVKTYYYSLSRKAADFGYEPIWTSLECITSEVASILGRTSSLINQ